MRSQGKEGKMVEMRMGGVALIEQLIRELDG